ncbi:hybrid sensor histidine kinase/response regulator [Pseudoalteromonas denitrificans]|uniref:histidine kinase n=1 Tax=Pseudoalteromonas denitrificans DSM 6059 TaxID=1123010 RepID=A0A1I1PSK9_9GAMM|nr:ATP-binding protein [Pseudoalteromonas denitrificans]SFD12662.1 His Kinase A (phospho-acceptor) domain-containing protein [Pseudoalteromonas denitrificans DSM 6059]
MFSTSTEYKKNITVTVVEDSKAVRSLIVHLLVLKDFPVTEFEFPQQAFEHLVQHPPRILITDFNMPVINGLELVRMCQEKQIEMRTILVTSFGDKDTLLNAIHAQIDYFVEKPFDSNSFYLALDKVVELVQVELDNESLIEELSFKNRELKEQMLRLKSIFSGLNEAILLLNKNGTIEYLNEMCCIYFDKNTSDLINLDINQILPISNVHEAFSNEQGEIELNYTKKDNLTLILSCKYSKFTILGKVKYLVSLSDISNIRQRQEFLEEKSDILEAEINQRTKDLTFAKEEAERANASKSEFLANMSHELRTPMHAMISFTHLILKRCHLIRETDVRDKIKDFASSLELSGERLLVLLNNLLDMAKLESGQSNFNPKNQTIIKLIDQGIAELSMLGSEKNIRIKRISDDDISPWYDFPLVLQVLINLLSNAIKFSPEDSEIQVGFHKSFEKIGKRDADSKYEVLNIDVIDSGIGIPESELRLVFDKFTQSTATKTGAGGTGLGLSICKELITLHYGKIFAKNNPKHGTTFTFYIPIHKPHWCKL